MERKLSKADQVWSEIFQQRRAQYVEWLKTQPNQRDESDYEQLSDLAEKFHESMIDFTDQIAKAINGTLHHMGMEQHVLRDIYRLRRNINHLLEEKYQLTEEMLKELDQAHQADHEAWRKRMDRMENLATMPYTMYLKTPHWQEMRLGALRRANNRCELCNSTRWLDVHHKTYERRGQELDSDLIVLCRDCHSKFHDKLES